MNKSGYKNIYSPEQISQIGEKIYFEKLKDSLEKEKRGQYLVLDVETEKYETDPDKLRAIEKAEKKLGKKLFYILQIGDLQRPVANLRVQQHAWNL